MYEVSNVHLGEYSIESTNQRLICTENELRHIDEEREGPHGETILLEEISDVSRDTDKSLVGFTWIGGAFAMFALVFTGWSVWFLLADAFVTPVVGGVYLSAALCWFGFIMFYTMEHETIDVLEVQADTERYRFLTQKDGTTFDEISAHLSNVTELRSHN